MSLPMAFYEVYSHPALLRYKTSVCTKATLFLVVVLCLTYIPPLLVAYRSHGNVTQLMPKHQTIRIAASF